jgi:hypothetical protein
MLSHDYFRGLEMPEKPTIDELVQVIENLLKHAVYDEEHNDECITAVRDARYMLHVHAETKNG